MTACLRFTRKVFQDHLKIEGHDFKVLSQLSIVSARPGLVKATLPVTSSGLNRGKTLHGGVLASLTDTMGSLALSSHGLHYSGVSTDMGTTCVRTAGTTGDVLSIQSEVVSLGRTLGFTRIEMRDSKDRLVAFGHHTKFVGRSGNPELDVKFDEDGEQIFPP
ncbi:Thioesterase/thiol ester dehydrase-isomerase [Mrakia frigida]|uniref:PaaI family thioesterase n=1 Tax=Mrakia frigida TaxID=29902 RepID=UPI003FCC013F